MDIKIQRRIGLVIGLLVIGFLVGAWLLFKNSAPERKIKPTENPYVEALPEDHSWPEYKDGKG